MGFSLDNVVPWGRSYDEYVGMFSLTTDDLAGRILGCGDGPASFNCTLSRRGGSVLSIDPLYSFSTGEIRHRIEVTFHEVMKQVRENQDEFLWTSIGSPEVLATTRMSAMNDFLADYDKGCDEKRYVHGELPSLPFDDNQFDLALSSHFLFLYSEQLNLEFHLASIRELCRVAADVRLFPLLELGAKRSRHLDILTSRLRKEGYGLEINSVDYEFQRGGNKMMKITSSPLKR
ncbi:class I SAM-dependent methyltransferase [Desulfopila sp. IMCC35008]|uniref:class I SAM-dependent methyltransferase n=1 Tax=Desulfopila sp. IMCC35008 TaxID=2653858 RepID=UPI0013D4D969|nr:class I SAM-dependent methyltransferase [Desulfopila sp. IMCC35008]